MPSVDPSAPRIEGGPPFTAIIGTQAGDTRVRCVGELDLASASLLVDLVTELVKDGHRSLVLDLDTLHFIDACGLSALVAAHTFCADNGATLTLCGGRPLTQKLLAITGLSTVLCVR
jgi:anti-sigma B factor antagonist